MKKKLSICIISIMLVIISIFPNVTSYAKKENKIYFEDESASTFSTSTISQIKDLLKQTSDYIDMDIGVYVGSTFRDENSTESFTDEKIKKVFGKTDDAVLLYLDNEGQSPAYDFLRTRNNAKLYFTDKKNGDRIKSILENVEYHLPASPQTFDEGEGMQAIETFCRELEYYYKIGPESGAKYHNDIINKEIFVESGVIKIYSGILYDGLEKYLLIGILVGLVLGGASVAMIFARYKFKTSENTATYIKNGDFNLYLQEDCFIRKYITTRHIDTSSSESKGSSGGGSSGGGGSYR